jgi:hypothetical protein
MSGLRLEGTGLRIVVKNQTENESPSMIYFLHGFPNSVWEPRFSKLFFEAPVLFPARSVNRVKRSFVEVRSQAELGNEMIINRPAELTNSPFAG